MMMIDTRNVSLFWDRRKNEIERKFESWKLSDGIWENVCLRLIHGWGELNEVNAIDVKLANGESVLVYDCDCDYDYDYASGLAMQFSAFSFFSENFAKNRFKNKKWVLNYATNSNHVSMQTVWLIFFFVSWMLCKNIILWKLNYGVAQEPIVLSIDPRDEKKTKRTE